MNTQEIHDVMEETQAGRMVFGEVVRRLLAAGVESYFCDYAKGEESFYMVDGKAYAHKMTLAMKPIASEFSETDLVTAIRGAQADTIRYPEFAKRAMAAGVIGYWAYLTGRKVVYFGRKGEAHEEKFPPARP